MDEGTKREKGRLGARRGSTKESVDERMKEKERKQTNKGVRESRKQWRTTGGERVHCPPRGS